MEKKISDIRQDYDKSSLTEQQAGDDPFALFSRWLEESLGTNPEPTAANLATVKPDGNPTSRIVLLKDFTREGFHWFTNYQSDKGKELQAHPRACLSFFWSQSQRQVRTEGTVEKISAQESTEYFLSRPLESRIGAWVSPQSQVIPGREYLEKRLTEFKNKFGDNPPRPEHWGGYRLRPDFFEFWQGRPSRLHDRIRFVLTGKSWIRERLAP